MYKLVLNSGRGCLEDQEETITEGLETFENELAKRGSLHFAKNKPGMLDYMIWPWCERADLLKLFGNQFSLRKDKYKRLVRSCLFLLILGVYLCFVCCRWSGAN